MDFKLRPPLLSPLKSIFMQKKVSTCFAMYVAGPSLACDVASHWRVQSQRRSNQFWARAKFDRTKREAERLPTFAPSLDFNSSPFLTTEIFNNHAFLLNSVLKHGFFICKINAMKNSDCLTAFYVQV